ncbi:MAG TPA: ATP-binding protein [Pyrinomonadaceae bacterium]|nr:ATP-binding protein [Pyrinomonadaceae bacterium]
MRYSLKNVFRDRKHAFSDLWLEIIQSRFVLCVVVATYSRLAYDSHNLKQILVSTGVYLAAITLLGFWDLSTLRRRRVRAIPALLDVLFVSAVIYLTGGQDSPWFLLYLFPIISVSRYLSYGGSLSLMALTVVAYTSVVLIGNAAVDYYSLTLKCLVFLGIALVAGNLTEGSQRREENILEIFKEIDDAILDNSATNEVLRLILRKAAEYTESDMARMKLIEAETNSAYTITYRSETLKSDWDINSLTEENFEKAVKSKKPFSIRRINGAGNLPKSALFVPLILRDEVKAVIALYSRNSFHYTATQAIKLGSFAQLLGVALKNYKMYQGIAESESEKKARLKMLYKIGEQLKVEQGLDDLFKKVVDLVYDQLNSEEASLFILDEKNEVLLKKAVKGPSEDVTKKLQVIEKPYKPGESLVGKIFKDREPEHLNHVPPEIAYHGEYSQTLPSRKVCHYIGVPLIIGEEVLGVLRVINKRVATPWVEGWSESDTLELSKEGFGEDDAELLQTIASQVASAIRSAKFIEVQRYYQELLENSPDPIIALDRSGRITIFNEACEKIWGYSVEEVKGKLITRYFKSKEDVKDISRLLAESPHNRLHDQPAEIKARDGESIPIILSAALLFDREGKRVGIIGVFKDFRETLRLQEENTRAAKLAALGKLAHTVGHEIKHNIATGLNYIDTLAFECADDEELSVIFRDIQEHLNEAVDRFQNMLMVGRPKSPEMRLVSHRDIISRVEASLRRRAASKNIDFIINSPGDAQSLEADVEQLKQVLTNLFDNSLDAIAAKRFVGEKGRIELAAQANNGDLHLTWRDNGCGISAARLSQMFTPFATTKPTGNGLGLFIIKDIIEKHGGSISVESKEGEGTSFKIVLPLSDENKPAG